MWYAVKISVYCACKKLRSFHTIPWALFALLNSSTYLLPNSITVSDLFYYYIIRTQVSCAESHQRRATSVNEALSKLVFEKIKGNKCKLVQPKELSEIEKKAFNLVQKTIDYYNQQEKEHPETSKTLSINDLNALIEAFEREKQVEGSSAESVEEYYRNKASKTVPITSAAGAQVNTTLKAIFNGAIPTRRDPAENAYYGLGPWANPSVPNNDRTPTTGATPSIRESMEKKKANNQHILPVTNVSEPNSESTFVNNSTTGLDSGSTLNNPETPSEKPSESFDRHHPRRASKTPKKGPLGKIRRIAKEFIRHVLRKKKDPQQISPLKTQTHATKKGGQQIPSTTAIEKSPAQPNGPSPDLKLTKPVLKLKMPQST